MKKVVSFSLWGDQPKYCTGAIRNAELVGSIYPGWEAWFYCGSSVPDHIKDRLIKLGCRVINKNVPGDWTGMFWRFEAIAEPNVDVMISRDVDSRISKREAFAVEEWLKSDKSFHIMRDHPAHATEILGGMWGAKKPILSDIKNLILSFVKGNFWQVDQNFLREIVWPRVKNETCTHDEFFEKLKFPMQRNGAEFVGQVFDENEIPNLEFARSLLLTVKKPIVMISSDENPVYNEFIEPVKLAWENLGFHVMCEKITNLNKFVPFEQIPSANQAQICRPLIPALFPENIFLISDVDMLPLNSGYFHHPIQFIDSQVDLITFSSDAYIERDGFKRYPMCYFLGNGSAFSKVTGVKTRDDLIKKMISWWSGGFGWETDEICFSKEIKIAIDQNKIRFGGLNRGWYNGYAERRIDRGNWGYDEQLLKSHQYVDSHMLRPLSENINQLVQLFKSVGVEITTK